MKPYWVNRTEYKDLTRQPFALANALFVDSFDIVGTYGHTGVTNLTVAADGSRFLSSMDWAERTTEFTMAEPWKLEGATHTDGFTLSGAREIRGLSYFGDGEYLLVGDPQNTNTGNRLYRLDCNSYKMAYGWGSRNIPTETDLTDVFVRNDGLRYYQIGNSTLQVRAYSISPANDIRNLSLISSWDMPEGFGWMWFSPDGLQMWLGKTSKINRYSLSAAWDASAPELVETVTGFDAQSGCFSPDGKYFYELTSAGVVKRYSLFD